MANPTQSTTLPATVTFSADGLSGKAGTLRGIYATETGIDYYVTYQDDAGGIRGVYLKASDITLSA